MSMQSTAVSSCGKSIELPVSKRDRFLQENDASCWLCNSQHAVGLNICHLISASYASQATFNDYQRLGILPKEFYPGSEENMILLCQRCHTGFDATPPTWALVPSDFVIKQVIAAFEAGVPYLHAGGSVDCVAVFLHEGMVHNFPQSYRGIFPKPARVHPIAALIKAYPASVRPRLWTELPSLMPGRPNHQLGMCPNTRNLMFRLMKLWCEAATGYLAEREAAARGGVKGAGGRGRRRDEDSEGEEGERGPPAAKKKIATEELKANHRQHQTAAGAATDATLESVLEFGLEFGNGLKMTTEDIVKKYLYVDKYRCLFLALTIFVETRVKHHRMVLSCPSCFVERPTSRRCHPSGLCTMLRSLLWASIPDVPSFVCSF